MDTLLSFDHPMGDDYSGAWLDASTFVFTALDTEAARPPMVGQTTVRFNPDFTWASEPAGNARPNPNPNLNPNPNCNSNPNPNPNPDPNPNPNANLALS